MIVTPLIQTLFEVYADKILGRPLTVAEKKRIILYKGNGITFARNKYYREVNKIIEEAIKEIGGIV